MKTYNQRTQDILKKAETQKMRNTKTIKTATLLSVLLTVILAFNLFMFVPYRTGGIDITLYRNNKYYSVIEKVSELTYEKAEVKSNFQRFAENFKGCGSAVDDEGAAMRPTSPDAPTSPGHADEYNEVTNNQTDGVIEGDLFKRGGDKVYYLDYGGAFYGDDGRIGETITDYADFKDQNGYYGAEYKLQIYPLNGMNTKKAEEFLICEKDGMQFSTIYGREMFLSLDCKTVTVLSPCKNQAGKLYTAVISIDVSDTASIKEINRTYISGQYVSSRMTDGNLLLVSNFKVRRQPDFSDETQYLPHTGTPEKFTPLPLEDIVCPDDATSANYTIICSLDEKTLEITGSTAFLSFSDEVYVSENNLFVTRTHITSNYPISSIYCVAYGEGKLDFAGNCEIDGQIINRYCMDEYEGVLRVVTDVDYSRLDGYKGASLYCIDLNNFETIGKYERFAPDGEAVKSARFDKDVAYVCTAVTFITLSDPVFAFDLSDYGNITYKDTGTIPGYSLSLTKFKDDTLLGIGYGDTLSDLKVELYIESNSKVESVAAYELKSVDFSEEYKAHFIDAEKGLIGLGYYNGDTHYIVLRYDGYTLSEVAKVNMNSGYDAARACMTDEYMYVFSHDGVKVIDALLLI